MASRIDYVVFGEIAAIEAEYGLVDMGEDWLRKNRYRYVVKIIAEDEYDVEFFTNLKDTRTNARDLAKELGGVPVYHI